jgi:oxaloacetate decarboxylase (Na+ extruding) subunit alpha
MTEVRFVDTTIRDGPLSLWANNMRTGQMLAVAEDLDRAGFEAIETIYEQPKKIVRELREDPWERLRLLGQHYTQTPLRTILGRFTRFELSPAVLFEMMVECLARAGVRQARVSDDWNQPAGWAMRLRLCRAVGMEPILNLIYSLSPKHTDEYYAERARQAAALDPYRLCLKDPGGLLTPDRLRTLVPTILANAGGKYVELHSHCTTGLGPLNALEAVKLGIRTVNTGIPPLANGAALPNVFNVARNVRALGYQPVYDEVAARAVSAKLEAIAERERFPRGAPVEYDQSWYAHQVPGGMISNIRHQLQRVGLSHRFQATLEECARVRQEWGYPIMVTPLAQFVGTQAAINVIVGERYKQVSDQTILYALGHFGGEEAIEALDPNVRDLILDRPRARELAAWEPPQPTRAEARARWGGPGVSDEELLLRYEVGEAALAELRAAGPPRSEDALDADQPLVTLVAELTRRADRRYVHVQKGDFSLTLQRTRP